MRAVIWIEHCVELNVSHVSVPPPAITLRNITSKLNKVILGVHIDVASLLRSGVPSLSSRSSSVEALCGGELWGAFQGHAMDAGCKTR